MNTLDDINKIEQLDPQGMLEVEENFYNQLLEGQKIAEAADLSQIAGKKYSGLVFVGMGGSGISGDIIASLAAHSAGVNLVAVKGYNLPAYVTKDWLVVASSYSGNTEETISCVKQAAGIGAAMLFITSGGKLKQLAADYDDVSLISLPSGYQPRGAFGYLFMPAYMALGRLGLIDTDAGDIQEGLDMVKQLGRQFNRNNPYEKNYAKQLAVMIGDRLPVVYGQEGYLGPIAYRWKCEINENAKTPCFWAQFPELNHNETVGWDRLAPVTKNFVLIIFTQQQGNKRIEARIEATRKLIEDNLGKVIEVPVKGKSRFARALSTLYTGDITSVYLALYHGVDPTPVEKIEKLKAELSKLD
ncbi:MAG: bifunctional phosphoglucose/phosphomannose isomerase [Actinomycetia bacterium]|nr:bifunctional phosphoglucose/phosphomannose isomerase [Actinomycetes bacterium]